MLAWLAVEQVRDGHEFESLRAEAVERRGHGIDELAARYEADALDHAGEAMAPSLIGLPGHRNNCFKLLLAHGAQDGFQPMIIIETFVSYLLARYESRGLTDL